MNGDYLLSLGSDLTASILHLDNFGYFLLFYDFAIITDSTMALYFRFWNSRQK